MNAQDLSYLYDKYVKRGADCYLDPTTCFTIDYGDDYKETFNAS